MKKNITFIVGLLICNSVGASDDMTGKEISLYNVLTGALIFATDVNGVADLSAAHADEFHGGWNKHANWTVKQYEDGSYGFVNKRFPQVCLTAFFTGYKIKKEECYSYNQYQKFTAEKTSTKAVILKVKNGKNECISMESMRSGSKFAAYTGTCPSDLMDVEINNKWLWSMIPPLEDAYTSD